MDSQTLHEIVLKRVALVGRCRHDVLHAPAAHHLAMREDCHARADVLHVEELVRRDEDGEAIRGEAADELLDLTRADGVESGSRL